MRPKSASPPPNGTWLKCSSATGASWSPRDNSSRRDGDLTKPKKPTICGCFSPRSGASWNRIRPIPGTSSPNQGWATVSRVDHDIIGNGHRGGLTKMPGGDNDDAALSDEERAALADLEAALARADPNLGHRLRLPH